MSNGYFNGVGIGDHCWAEISHANEVEVHKIPRADGAILRRRGGGVKTITVHGWVKKTKRKDLEIYLNALAAAFGSDLGDLVVNGNTYSNCILKSVSPDSDYNRWSIFSIIFYRSGD